MESVGQVPLDLNVRLSMFLAREFLPRRFPPPLSTHTSTNIRENSSFPRGTSQGTNTSGKTGCSSVCSRVRNIPYPLVSRMCFSPFSSSYSPCSLGNLHRTCCVVSVPGTNFLTNIVKNPRVSQLKPSRASPQGSTRERVFPSCVNILRGSRRSRKRSKCSCSEIALTKFM